MYTRKIAGLLLVPTALSVLLSCGGSGGAGVTETQVSSSGTSAPAETTTALTEIREELPERDYKGYEFRILNQVTGYKIYNNEHMAFEAENGELLNDALFRRNKTVEERFGVTISEIVDNAKTATFKTAVLSGDDMFDISTLQNGQDLGGDYLLEVSELPYVDRDKPWWNNGVLETQTVGGKLYRLLGDMGLGHYDGVVVTFFNKELAEKYKLPDMYRLVRDGKWTLDKMYELGKPVSGDLDGNGTMDHNDLWPFTALTLNSYTYFLISAGENYAVKDKDDLPAFNLASEKVINIVDRLTKLFDKSTLFHHNPTFSNTSGEGDAIVFTMFGGGRTLFLAHGVGSCQMYRDIKADFGILPAAKYSEGQETYLNQSSGMKYVEVPVTCSDPERTSVILEAMSAESSRSVIPKYYEAMLLNKYFRDDDSVEMMNDYIMPSLVPYVQAGAGLHNAFGAAIKSGNYVSAIASQESALKAKITAYIEAVTKK